MPLTEQTRRNAREIIARYPKPRSSLLPLLHLVQAEEGYVTPAGVALCAEELGLTKAEVGAVATFYTMYKRVPTGEYLISVCTNTLCGMLGGDEIFAELGKHLGVADNQTTADGTITLEHAECLAACDYAPVVTVNYEYFDNQTTDSAIALAEELRSGKRPLPSRGAPLCSFREISRQLAGFIDERPAARDAVSVGEPTLIGVRVAQQRGEGAPPYPGQPADPDQQGPTRPAGSGDGRAGAASRVGASAQASQPSANDAPQQTAASDPAAQPDAATPPDRQTGTRKKG